MTIPVSTAPAFKRALVDAILAQLSDPGVLVCYDEPPKRQPNRVIEVGAVEVENSTAGTTGSGGAGWLQEVYVVTVLCSAWRTAGDTAAADADADAWALVAAVHAAVRSDPTFDGLVGVARPLQSRQQGLAANRGPQNREVRVSEIETHIRVTTVI